MTTLTGGRRVASIALIVALLFPSAPTPAPALEVGQFEGFGAVTRGGAGGAVVRVTTLADSGPGSLREAAAGGARTIVFDVAGDITLSDYIRVRGSFVTIDGLTAPSPGITLRGHGVAIEGTAGAHDVIVRGLRVRGAIKDGIRVAYGASNVVIDHVSVHGSGDGNLDISESRDVTVSWSILAEPAIDEKNMLIKYAPAHVTLHHNLFTEARQRNPQVRIDDAGTLAKETTLDMRNNVVWRWPGGYGTLVWYGPRANVVNNYFASPGSSAAEQARALAVQNGARAYVAGNVSGDGVLTVNTVGTDGTPFDAPPVTIMSACEAALAVVQGAGMRPLDAIDARYVDAVTLPGCIGTTPPPPGPAQPDLVIASLGAPSRAAPGSVIAVTVTTRNSGTAVAGPSTTAIHLSTDAGLDAGDPTLASLAVPSLAAGASDTATVNVAVPSNATAGTYRLIARADDGGAVAEWSDTNNTLAAGLILGDTGAGTGGGTGQADLAVVELTGPRTIAPGGPFVASDKVKNRGAGPAPATTVAFYLSRERRSVTGAVALGTRSVPPLAVGASSSSTTTLTVPAGTATGDYYLIAVADAGGAVTEAIESNNLRARAVNVR